MGAYFGEFALVASDGVTPAQLALARKMLGVLDEDAARAGAGIQSMTRRLNDGSVVLVQRVGSQRRVTVVQAGEAAATEPPVTTEVWIPQGFVFTPGDGVSPTGYGLPVRAAAGSSAFDADNVAPGNDVHRWTAGGRCADVLITQQDTSNYPDLSKYHLPIAFNDREWLATDYSLPPTVAWHAQRPTFNDFSWMKNSAITSRRQLWNAIQTTVNQPLALPFAGYYDDAQLVAELGAAMGTTPSAWPAPYNTAIGRENADGAPNSYADAWTTQGVLQLVAALGALPADCPSLDAGQQSFLQVATVRDQSTWIHAGNQFWHPSDPSLPTLSWNGYPAQNLPNWLVSGGWVGDVGSAIFPLEGWHYEWRGQTRYVFSRKLYAMGRCIGVLPATVISAAIRVETLQRADGTKYQVNRVVVITWDAADQFGNAGGIAYLWKFGVWCVDFPRDGTIPLHVTAVPVGTYDATSNPTGWQRCGTFTFSTPGDVAIGDLTLPGYAPWQLWRFNGEGTRAVAVVGTPPYSADWGPGGRYVEAVFNDVEPGALNVATNLQDASGIVNGSASWPIAADYAADGRLRFVAFARGPAVYTGGMTVEGAQSPSDSIVWWTGGDVAQSMGSAFDAFVPDTCVLSAADGALGLARYPLTGTAPALTETRGVRLVHAGATVAVDTFVDAAVSMLSLQHENSYLSDTLMSYAADRAGNWMLGYDAGLTAGSSIVYDPTAPLNAPFKPAPVSTHLNSHWLSNIGDVAGMAKFDGAMRAYPLGVC